MLRHLQSDHQRIKILLALLFLQYSSVDIYRIILLSILLHYGNEVRYLATEQIRKTTDAEEPRDQRTTRDWSNVTMHIALESSKKTNNKKK